VFVVNDFQGYTASLEQCADSTTPALGALDNWPEGPTVNSHARTGVDQVAIKI
jgi:hypothetical protein